MPGEDDLFSHLQALTGLDRALLGKVLDEVRAWYGDDPVSWTRRRHAELQRLGLRNEEIYARLQEELRRALFAGGERTERQVRRMIYG